MGFLGFRDGCGRMQPNWVEFEQEKMEGTMKLEGTSNEGGFKQMGLRKQQKGRMRNKALNVVWRGRGRRSDRRG